MLKIRHYQTREMKEVSIGVWTNKYNHDNWEILESKDIVILHQFIKNKWVKKHKMEKEAAIKLITEFPNFYRFEDLPDKGNLLPIKTPIIYGIKIIAASAKSFISKVTKNQLIKAVVAGMIVYLLGHYIVKHYGYLF